MHIFLQLKENQENRQELSNKINQNEEDSQIAGERFLNNAIKSLDLDPEIILEINVSLNSADLSFRKNDKEMFNIYIRSNTEHFFSVNFYTTTSQSTDTFEINRLILLGKVVEFFNQQGSEIRSELNKVLEPYNTKSDQLSEERSKLMSVQHNLEEFVKNIFYMKVIDQGTQLPVVFKDSYVKIISQGEKETRVEISYKDGRPPEKKRYGNNEFKRLCFQCYLKHREEVREEIKEYYEKTKFKEKVSGL